MIKRIGEKGLSYLGTDSGTRILNESFFSVNSPIKQNTEMDRKIFISMM